MPAVSPAITSQHHHDIACVVAWSPQPVTLVVADGLGQPIFWAKIVDCTGFSIIVGKDGGAGALLRRQAVVDPGHFSHQRLPAKLVCKVLRQMPGRLVFGFGWLPPDGLL